MVTYKTLPEREVDVGNSALAAVLNHFAVWGVSLTSAEFVDGRYLIQTAPDLLDDQIEHLSLEVLDA